MGMVGEWRGRRLVFRFLLRLVGSKLVMALGHSCTVISSYTVWLAL
jgi:hypothetical protein